MKAMSIFGLGLFIAALISCSPDQDAEAISQPQQPSQPVTQPQTPYVYSADERQLASLINDYRQSVGKSELSLHPYASTLAQGHNAYMIANDVMNHDFFEQRADELRETIGAFNIGENVAFNYQAPSGALQAWLDSEGHRATVEGSFTHIGLSISADAGGRHYYTALFVSIPQ
ncbi:CAP domain-containing protein [Flavobacterium selenitireducens]|uniref:CAP domain-containing protein n=1 Tax=Flavobacterium selenitireducens TaxID=2722704 RepID=UPI00168AE6A6|nr:CAP domain-containing protein [Flavobacterium selenitireducens]MBD3581170.1 CAP domain-containing protein [Flavobacterium selenitireducens]